MKRSKIIRIAIAALLGFLLYKLSSDKKTRKSTER